MIICCMMKTLAEALVVILLWYKNALIQHIVHLKMLYNVIYNIIYVIYILVLYAKCYML